MTLGEDTFCYATPFCGYAQIVTAYTAKIIGAKSVIFYDKYHGNDRGRHPLTDISEGYGATVIECKTLDDAMQQSAEYRKGKPSYLNIPLGFDDPYYCEVFYNALKIQWEKISAKHKVTELWLPVGSGTLAKTLAKIVPENIPIYCVTVNALPREHQKIEAVKDNPRISKLYYAPELFVEESEIVPPIPSNIYYDAKIFRFAQKYAQDGALWWNVAK